MKEQTRGKVLKEANDKGLFWYRQAKDLGFERTGFNDSVYFDQKGQQPFFMELKLNKGISMNWDCDTCRIELLRCNKDADVLGRIRIRNYDHLIEMINFFTGKKKTIDEVLESAKAYSPNDSIMNAC